MSNLDVRKSWKYNQLQMSCFCVQKRLYCVYMKGVSFSSLSLKPLLKLQNSILSVNTSTRVTQDRFMNPPLTPLVSIKGPGWLKLHIISTMQQLLKESNLQEV